MEEYVNINKADEEFLRKYMPSFEASNMIAEFYSVFGDQYCDDCVVQSLHFRSCEPALSVS